MLAMSEYENLKVFGAQTQCFKRQICLGCRGYAKEMSPAFIAAEVWPCVLGVPQLRMNIQ